MNRLEARGQRLVSVRIEGVPIASSHEPRTLSEIREERAR